MMTVMVGLGAELMLPAIWSLAIYAVSVSIALYKVWVSTGKRNLNRLNEAIIKANIVIDHQAAELMRLTNRNDELKTIQNGLDADLRDMNVKYSELTSSYNRLAADYAEVKKELRAERELRDRQYMQLTEALVRLDQQQTRGF